MGAAQALPAARAHDRRDDARQALRDAVSQLVNEEGFRRWVEVRSRFRRYSFGNCLLIAAQFPGATHVAGYRAWQALDRQVRRGERAIRILAPMVVKRPDANGDPERVVVGFKAVNVFDVSQTDGEALPEPPECVKHGGDELGHCLPALEGHARELGYVVYRYRPEGGALGYCDPIGRRIVIDPSLSPNAQVSTLVHELAHAHGLTYRDRPRAECEVIVEATTAIVLGSLGFDPAGFSVPYIASWAKDDDGLKALETFATTIDSTARKIEKALGVAGGGPDA
jgi:antirestriction protein ArdC